MWERYSEEMMVSEHAAPVPAGDDEGSIFDWEVVSNNKNSDSMWRAAVDLSSRIGRAMKSVACTEAQTNRMYSRQLVRQTESNEPGCDDSTSVFRLGRGVCRSSGGMYGHLPGISVMRRIPRVHGPIACVCAAAVPWRANASAPATKASRPPML